MKGINEYTCITLKVLRSIAHCGILLPDIDAEQRREDENDRHGRTTYTRGSIPYPQSIRVYHQEVHYPRKIGRRQSRGTLAHQARGSQKLRREPNQAQKQIKKATPGCQTKQFTAVSLPLKVLANARDKPRINLPTFSITKVRQQCNGYTTMWAYERRCAHE